MAYCGPDHFKGGSNPTRHRHIVIELILMSKCKLRLGLLVIRLGLKAYSIGASEGYSSI